MSCGSSAIPCFLKDTKQRPQLFDRAATDCAGQAGVIHLQGAAIAHGNLALAKVGGEACRQELQ